MFPTSAHDVVEQRMRQRLDQAAAERLGGRRRGRRSGRRTRRPATEEPTLHRVMVVAPYAP